MKNNAGFTKSRFVFKPFPFRFGFWHSLEVLALVLPYPRVYRLTGGKEKFDLNELYWM